VALPDEHEETDPSFAHFDASALPVHEDGGLRTRLLAGKAFGLESRVRTHSPLFYAHWELDTGKRAALPAEFSERAVYVAAGEVEAQGRVHGAGRMLVFDRGEDSTIAATARSTLMALGGEPVGPRFIEWNFVSSSRERIEQAKSDWRSGRMKLPDFDNQEFIPLA
jgi:redox-sensitive bicupin YhaK (pirin superfamily)